MKHSNKCIQSSYRHMLRTGLSKYLAASIFVHTKFDPTPDGSRGCWLSRRYSWHWETA